ncbi:hypothetical protein JCM10212_000753 [Sporobolomyces blumeae]
MAEKGLPHHHAPSLDVPTTTMNAPPGDRHTRAGFVYRSKSLAGEPLQGFREEIERRWSRRNEVRPRTWAGIAAGVILTWFFLSRISGGETATVPPCDPFQAPGRLLINLTSPLHTMWLPLDPAACPPLPPYLPALWTSIHGKDRAFPTYPAATFPDEYRLMAAEPLTDKLASIVEATAPPDPISFLRKRRVHPPTVLLLGDSVDRNGLVQFCQLFRQNVTISHYHDIKIHPPGPYPADLTRGHGPKFDGWDQRGLMHRCEIPFANGRGTAVRIVNGFHYGMDALDEFNTPDHTDWHAPGKIEDRIDKLVMPAIEQLGGPDKVDVVQIHSGMWDLALFGMQDDKTRWSLTTALTPEQLAWWQERMTHTIFHVRQRFPKARILFRKLHRTDDMVAGTQRVNQLRHLQEEVARTEGLPIFDFNRPLEGYQLFQEKVHPLLVPGGVVYAQNVLHQLQLALESPTSWRKGIVMSSQGSGHCSTTIDHQAICRQDAMASEREASPELEFGTFLRLPHESRTRSRPADSYIPSSPPSRPTSPIPSSASPGPAPVFLHGRPAPVVGKMRQGAPRLGGLGLGGIVEPGPTPSLPVRRAQVPTTTSASDSRRVSMPPAIPAAAPRPLSPRPASPASVNGAMPSRSFGTPPPPNRPSTAESRGSLPERPFLSPEMDQVKAREGAFALDRPKFEDVIKKPVDENDKGSVDKLEQGSVDQRQDEDANGSVGEIRRSTSDEGFPVPTPIEEESGDPFNRFKAALEDDDETPAVYPTSSVSARDVDTVSVRSSGDSLFATPDTVAASDDDDEVIPALHLDADPEGGVSHVREDEKEDIAFDGRRHSSEEVIETEPEGPSHPEEDLALAEPTDLPPSETIRHVADPTTIGEPPSVADALLFRSERSHLPDEATNRSPATSTLPSVESSRAPSPIAFRDEEDQATTPDLGQAAPYLSPLETIPLSPTSISRLSTPGLSDEASPSALKADRELDDPAAQYPSPPSSPPSSFDATPLPDESAGMAPKESPSSIYEDREDDRAIDDEQPAQEATRHVESFQGLSDSDETTAETTPVPPAGSRFDGAPAETPSVPSFPSARLPPLAESASIISPNLGTTPRNLAPASPSKRRSRFSYQGLGLRMPSSIAPRAVVDSDEIDDVVPRQGTLSPVGRATQPSLNNDSKTASKIAETTPDSTAFTPAVAASSIESAEPAVGLTAGDAPVSPTCDRRNSGMSSPSIYGPSTAAPSPEITRAPSQPVGLVSPDSLPAAIDASGTDNTFSLPLISGLIEPPSPNAVERRVGSPTLSSSSSGFATPTEGSDREDEAPQPHEASNADGTSSSVGTAVDIGAAVAGALVMGGLAVGQSAWKGLAVGWSAWRGANNQSVVPETTVVELSNVEASQAFKDYGRPTAENQEDAVEKAENEAAEPRKAESSVVSTEWGEAEFEAPEGFLEDFKKAMEEIGEEDLRANEQAQIDAQTAAYESATRQHDEAIGSPTISDTSSLSSVSSRARGSHASRSREISSRSVPPATIDEDSADEDERELEDLMSPIWNSPSRPSKIDPNGQARRGSPGKANMARPSSVVSNSTFGSKRTTQTQTPSIQTDPRQRATEAKTKKSFFGFGKRSKSSKDLAKHASAPPAAPNDPRSNSKARPESMLSNGTPSTTLDDSRSRHSATSTHKSERRSSIFHFGKDMPPVPTIESQIKDTTYISYGTTDAKLKRVTSDASVPTGLYASRDNYLITPDAPGPRPRPPQVPPSTVSASPRSIPRSVSTTSDAGGAPLGRRRSSLRATSQFDKKSTTSTKNSGLTRSSSIVEGDKKLYRVRFGNAQGGIGLRHVAEAEAERAGGGTYGQRWVGVGRGRYGNMVIQTDERTDEIYAEQVAQIKKKWRAFGSHQSRDWAHVKID